MMKRRDFLKAAGAGAASLAAAPWLFGAEVSSGRPNILFVMTDQQFGDAMSCRMGKQYLHTPAMDSLAEDGTVFSRAYSPNPLCMPDRSSMFTGRYPHETGVTKNAVPKGGLDVLEFVHMGTYFKQAGYETAYYGKWHLVCNQKDVKAHGFDDSGGSNEAGLSRDEKVTSSAVRFLTQKHDKPFLMVASYLNPHNICEYARGQPLPCGPIPDAPSPEQCPPVPANLAPPQNEPDTMTMIRRSYHATATFPVGNFTPDQWRRQRWGYYRLIEKVDAEIGKVLQALRKAGLEENTLVVFTADHGECAGAHGFNQKTVFYDESARIPLIISCKGRTKQGVSDKLVNTGVDILPTLLDFAGVPRPSKLTGLSLRPLALGQEPAAWRGYVVVENHMSQGGEVDGITPDVQGRMVRTDRYKYCVYDRGNQRESLVDMQADPGEMNDLAADPKFRDVLLAHRELLARFGREHNDPLVAELLADNVKPRPFTAEGSPKGRRDRAAAGL